MRTIMKTRWIALTLLLAGAIGAAAAEPVPLPAAANLMFENNPLLQQKRLQAQTAAEQASSVRALYLPQIDFAQSLTRSNNPVFAFASLLNQGNFTQADFAFDSLNHPDALNDVSSRFQLGWLMYDFGKREAQVGAADSMRRTAALAEEAARSGLLQELVKRYYAVSLAQQRLVTARDSLASAQSRKQQAADRVEQGLAVSVEALSAEVFLARCRQEVIEAENQTQIAVAALREILGVADPQPMETTALAEKEYRVRDLSWWQEQMQTRRAELKIAGEGRRMAASGTTQARAEFFPTLQAYSAYEWHGKSLETTGQNWTAGVELRWNLFHGHSDSAQVSIARLHEREAEQKERETRNALALQLESAYYRFSAALEKVKVSQASLQQASENRRIYADRYAAGLASIQDSLQADAAYSESRMMHLQNLFEVEVSHSELLAAAGLSEQILTEEQL